MKTILMMVCWSISVLAVVYLAIGAPQAALPGRPIAAAGLALIGLGACIHARQRFATVD